jgi:uncharacterized membrane protein
MRATRCITCYLSFHFTIQLIYVTSVLYAHSCYYPAVGNAFRLLLFLCMPSLRSLSRGLLAVLFIGAGVLHFVAPATYLHIMPPYLPAPLALVYLSGAAEIAGGVGLLIPATRQLAGWGLILLLLAVFPANVYMLQTHGAGLAVAVAAATVASGTNGLGVVERQTSSLT